MIFILWIGFCSIMDDRSSVMCDPSTIVQNDSNMDNAKNLGEFNNQLLTWDDPNYIPWPQNYREIVHLCDITSATPSNIPLPLSELSFRLICQHLYDYGIDRYISNDSDDECTIAANQLPIPVPMKQLIVDEIDKKIMYFFAKYVEPKIESIN